MAELAFALENPAPRRPKSLAKKPDWWLAAVERETREHREERARSISDSGLERKDQALWLRDEIRQASNDELGFGPLAKHRALPGSTPEVKKVLRRWDTEVRQRSRGERRLLKAEHETTNQFRDRVFEEADRRLDSKWHADRARGQDERFERVRKCGKDERGVLRCAHCKTELEDKHGHPIVVQDRCDSTLLCASCRAHRIKKNRKRFMLSRIEAVHAIRRARLGPGQVPYDPIAERFLTLTCPHLALDQFIDICATCGRHECKKHKETRRLFGPEAQAHLVRTSFRSFMNSLKNRWRSHDGFKMLRYVRVLEATTGRDELGHVHIHVWMLTPFARAQVYRALWGRALIKAGFPEALWPAHAWKEKKDIIAELERVNDDVAIKWAKKSLKKRVPWPRVDIRRVRTKDTHADVDTKKESGERVWADLAVELVKYLCKDLESKDGTVLMHPALFAAVYRGLDSGRLITASAKFWIKQHSECPYCGALDAVRPYERSKDRPPLARGPPDFALTPCESA